jgi:uncharacterized FAD-dependent dehydrogenase
MAEKLLRIEGISLLLQDNENILVDKIAKILGTPKKVIENFKIAKKAIDSRDKKNILFVYSVDVQFDSEKILSHISKKNIVKHNIRFVEPYLYEIKSTDPILVLHRPVVVGS